MTLLVICYNITKMEVIAMSYGSEAVKRWRKRNAAKARDEQNAQQARRNGYAPPNTKEHEHPRPDSCELCKIPSTKTLHRDHCHTTGIHRGYLCVRCNVMLGNIEKVGLQAIRTYLNIT